MFILLYTTIGEFIDFFFNYEYEYIIYEVHHHLIKLVV